MNPFYRYIIKIFLKNIIFAQVFILFIYILFNVLQHLKYISSYNVNFLEILYFDVLKIPYSLYQVMPITIVLSTIITVVSLVKNNEMTAFVSIGGKTGGIAKIMIVFGLSVGFLTFILGEYINPAVQEKRIKYKAEVFEKKSYVKNSKIKDLWIKESENKFLSIKTVDPVGKKLLNLREYVLEKGKVILINTIEEAIMSDQLWVFKYFKSYDLKTVPSLVFASEEIIMKNSFFSKLVTFSSEEPKLLTFQEILGIISVYEDKGLNVSAYKLILYNKLSHPLSIVVLIFVILPICTSFSRQYSYISIVTKSISTGVGYWTLSAVSISLSKAGILTPLAGNFVPLIIFILVGFLLTFLKERGF